MAKYDFVTLDVFTTRRFCGNPLAVLPDAGGLSAVQMQAIAAEFNYSETTFVTTSEQGRGPRVRIFTPQSELPFAGHPTIGTAIALRELGKLTGDQAVLEENAGPVPVTFKAPNRAVFQAPGAPTIADSGSIEDAAKALSLPAGAIADKPVSSGAGLAFPMVQLRSMADLRAAKMSGADTAFQSEIYVFVIRDDGDLAVRLFAPGHGITEDPATGSAAAGLAVLLASQENTADMDKSWTIHQGVEMGRPSEIAIRAVKHAGKISAIHVEGSAVRVSQGQIEV